MLNATADTPIVKFEGCEGKEAKSIGCWVAAKDLKVGNKCLLSNGKTGIIAKLEVELLSEPETTYNFEVEGFHTYYVGEQGILVHNTCRAQAMRDAKSQLGIADDAIPDEIDKVRISEGVNGKSYDAKRYRYGDKWIRDDSGGHRFLDKSTRGFGRTPRYDKVATHLNIGETYINSSGKRIFIQYDGHIFYT